MAALHERAAILANFRLNASFGEKRLGIVDRGWKMEESAAS